MFSQISTASFVVLSTLTILAVATPWGAPPPVTTTVTETAPASTVTSPASQCNTGPVQCCNSVQSSDSAGVASLLTLLGVVIQGVAVPVGLTCTSIIGGNSCSSQAVCCSNNNFNGLVAIGCTPVNLSL